MSFLLALYYSAQMAGALAVTTRLARRFLPLPAAAGWIHALLALGLFPVFITLAGYAGLLHWPVLVMAMGAGFAAFGLYISYRSLPSLAQRARFYLASAEWRFVALFAFAFLCAFLYVRHCYWGGGANNGDEFHRGLPFTTAIAANHFKPAFPLDFSLPLVYSYYYYVWSAFFYGSVDGYSWPSIPLIVIAAVAIAQFYVILPLFLREFIHQPMSRITLLSMLAVSTSGANILTHSYLIGAWISDWPGLPWQIVQIANTGIWEYHYLVGASFCFASLICLRRGAQHNSSSYLIASALFIMLALTFATLTGAFFLGVLLFVAIWLLAKRELALGTALRALPVSLAATVAILAPQSFSFIGRASYLRWRQEPVLGFQWVPFHQTTMLDWHIVAAKINLAYGPLLLIGIAAALIYLFRNGRRQAFTAATLTGMLLMVLISLSFIASRTYDWYWRGPLFTLLILGTLGATWLFSSLWSSPRGKWIALPVLAACVLMTCQNFIIEHITRANLCRPAPPYIAQINAGIDLRTTIAATNIPSNQLGISTLTLAGRVAIVENDTNWGWMEAYLPPVNFRRQHLGWNGINPCGSGPLGPTIPGKMVSVRRTAKGLEIKDMTCPLPIRQPKRVD